MSVTPSRLFRRAFNKYRSDGPVQLVRTASGYLFDKLLFRGRLLIGDKYFQLFVKLRYQFQCIRYQEPAHPYEPICINPGSIDYRIYGVKHERGLGQIKGGNWDSSDNYMSIEDSRVYKGLKQRFEQNLNWEDTVYYKDAKQMIEQQGSKSGYTDISEYENIRCRYVDNLFISIRDEGYRRNSEITNDIPECDKRSTTWTWNNLEPLIVIGRTGEIYLCDGRHRFTIADILGINSIPMQVLIRHRDWQLIRDEFAAATDISDIPPELRTYADHPDLRDLLANQTIEQTPIVQRIKHKIKNNHILTQYVFNDCIYKKYYYISNTYDITDYEPSLDPFEIHWVDPERITEITRRRKPFKRDLGIVKSGCWDICEERKFKPDHDQVEKDLRYAPSIYFEDTLIYTAIKNRFKQGENWEDTKLVQTALSDVRNGRVAWRGITSEREVWNRLEYIDQLYANICRNGYKTQDHLNPQDTLLDRRKSEIMVDVARDGRLLQVEGQHRLAISKILDLEKIPIVISCRHQKWLQRLSQSP